MSRWYVVHSQHRPTSYCSNGSGVRALQRVVTSCRGTQLATGAEASGCGWASRGLAAAAAAAARPAAGGGAAQGPRCHRAPRPQWRSADRASTRLHPPAPPPHRCRGDWRRLLGGGPTWKAPAHPAHRHPPTATALSPTTPASPPAPARLHTEEQTGTWRLGCQRPQQSTQEGGGEGGPVAPLKGVMPESTPLLLPKCRRRYDPGSASGGMRHATSAVDSEDSMWGRPHSNLVLMSLSVCTCAAAPPPPPRRASRLLRNPGTVHAAPPCTLGLGARAVGEAFLVCAELLGQPMPDPQ